MTVRPIIFSAPMVRALLEGRKTQTRRIATLTNCHFGTFDRGKLAKEFLSAHADLRLAWADRGFPTETGKYDYGYLHVPAHKAVDCARCDEMGWEDTAHRLYPDAHPRDLFWVKETHALLSGPGGPVRYYATDNVHELRKKRPSIFMPRWASRMTLCVTDVCVQRLQDISQMDGEAEGVCCDMSQKSFRDHFRDLWERLHGLDAWNANPHVVALTFTVHKMNIDDFLKSQESPTPAGQDAGTSRKENDPVNALQKTANGGRGGKQPAPNPQ